jgi:protein-L-isoaspartate(D-aspartate) O-methyltransferase
MTARSGRFPLSLDRVAGAPAAPGGLRRPQAPVHQAAADSMRRVVPQGLGLDSDSVRARMVERLRADPGAPQAVLDAFARVARHHFVDTALGAQAYEDTSLPIGHGQTISKPSVVARMLSLLWAAPGVSARGHLGRVLEIGTGCGYQAALLGCLARHVVSVERLRPLHDRARDVLAGTRRDHLRLVFADGRFGHPPNAPYDAIIAACGGDDLPATWLEQMAVGGRLVAPCRAAAGSGQVLVVVDRTEQGWQRSVHEAVQFVPLESGTR